MKQRISPSQAQQLWQDYRTGDIYALANLMQAYYTDLYNWGLRFSNESEIVRDCLQELFLTLWQKQATIDEVDDVAAYLFKTVKNHLLMEFRKKSFLHTLGLTDEHYSLAVEFSADFRQVDEEHDAYRLRQLEQLLNQLPDRQREIIYLRFYQNLEFDQIAEIMQIGKQPVYNLLHKAIKHLREYALITLSWLLLGLNFFFAAFFAD